MSRAGNNVADFVPLPELAAGLAARIEELCREVLPGGRKEGPEWVAGSVHGEKGRSLSVHLRGHKAGIWADFADSQARGDALDLVAYCLFNGDKGEAAKWARSWLGLNGNQLDVARARQRARRQQERAAEEKQDKVPEKVRKRAKGIWLSAQGPLDTPVEDYLNGRNINLRKLTKVPGALKFHPELYDGESQKHWPAMIAAVHDHEGFLTFHRTFLEVMPGGRVRKAPLKAPKKAYSSFGGGSIRLARGYSGKPLAQAPDDDKVAICEGIEDGLVIALACPEYRVLAAVALNNMAAVRLPDQIREVMICPDNDPEGSTAAQALDAVFRAHLKAGRRVVMVKPPEGSKDFNDYYADAARGEA